LINCSSTIWSPGKKLPKNNQQGKNNNTNILCSFLSSFIVPLFLWLKKHSAAIEGAFKKYLNNNFKFCVTVQQLKNDYDSRNIFCW
jgi:hypothetical protein